MNVTELARKVKVDTKELLEILPVVGFHIGRRAIKIDNKQAQSIIKNWTRLLAQYKELTEVKEEKPTEEELEVKKAPVALPQYIRVKDLSEKLKISLPKVMAELMKNGVLSSMNEEIDFDTAAIVGSELGYEIIPADASAADEETSNKLESLLAAEDQSKLSPRPPVVVVMGHVDHGKTKLLDSIREANIAEDESGGITQHIGAYQAKKKDKLITFIDTPGHEAFTTMRSRGARVADVAILVIAADDSIQPQTKESIKIIKSAGLPMVVAINKIDKPGADIEKVKQDLATANLLPEDWGGKTITVPISAKAGTGLDDLLDMVLLVAETEQETIRANADAMAVGTIIESHIDKGEGPVATAIIQNGTLRKGDQVEVTETYYGKIKSMKDFHGKEVLEAGPSMPVKILGLKAAPSVGDVLQAKNEIDKKKKISKYQLTNKATDYTRPKEVDDKKKAVKNLNVILKSDVLGSLEAIIASLVKLDHDEVAVNIISKGLGSINETDVERAVSSGAWLIGFHVKPSAAASVLAKDKGIEIAQYDIIYKLIEDATTRLEALLSPEVIRTDIGKLKVLALFGKEKTHQIIGGKVTSGVIRLGAKADVVHAKTVLGKGTIVELQSNKVSANEVPEGNECGLKYEGKPIIEEGDVLELYLEVEKEKKLS